MKVTLIIQARSNSTRIKNKMFMMLGKYKILEWVILRLKKIRFVNNVIIATSNKIVDRNIIKIAKKNNLKVFAGSEKNVLKRFYLCSKKFPSDIIVRVCADNPLIDKKEIEKLILYFKKNYNKNDYLQNFLVSKNSIYASGFGAEIFKSKCLKEAFFNAKSSEDREHVTKYIRNNSKKFKSSLYFGNKNLHFPYLNFDVDTNKDLKNLSGIFKKLNVKLSTKGDMFIKRYLTKSINEDLINLFPINRSLTGSGNLKTLRYIQKKIPIKILSIKSGTAVYDWKVPHEWIVKNAYVKDTEGNYIIDYKNNNLSIVNYSSSYRGYLTAKQLSKKLYTKQNLTNAIPYKTSYYKKDWGFCVEQKNLKKIINYKKKFYVNIDTKFKKSKMDFGEILIKGKSQKEILISTYICHPSMANDNLSGIILTTYLTQFIKSLKNRYWTYRIIFIPETIGAIAYCKINEKKIKNVLFALMVNNVGGPGKISFKQSFDDDHFINTLINQVLNENKIRAKKYKFDIHGSDERQFSSQFFNINSASIHKDKYFEYKQYHTSADNLDFVKSENLFKMLKLYQGLIVKIESQIIFKTLKTKCEPMLSKYSLYPTLGGENVPGKKINFIDTILWLIFLSNGNRTVEQIAKKLKISKFRLMDFYKILQSKKIIKRI